MCPHPHPRHSPPSRYSGSLHSVLCSQHKQIIKCIQSQHALTSHKKASSSHLCVMCIHHSCRRFDSAMLVLLYISPVWFALRCCIVLPAFETGKCATPQIVLAKQLELDCLKLHGIQAMLSAIPAAWIQVCISSLEQARCAANATCM